MRTCIKPGTGLQLLPETRMHHHSSLDADFHESFSKTSVAAQQTGRQLREIRATSCTIPAKLCTADTISPCFRSCASLHLTTTSTQVSLAHYAKTRRSLE